MRRFFFDPEMRIGDRVSLSDQESYHIARVLRLQKDAEIELVDGRGGLFRAVVTEVGRTVAALIVEQMAVAVPEKTSLWVGQGLLKGKKMDTTLQQCTELGAMRLTPFVSSRCQGRPDELRERRKSDRWERIVVAACKQSRRTQPMRIDEVVDFPGMLALADAEPGLVKLIFWEEEEEVRLDQVMPADGPIERVCILLGPEGGFSGREIAAARELGWRTVSLGRRILRAETATLTAVSVVQYLIGNL